MSAYEVVRQALDKQGKEADTTSEELAQAIVAALREAGLLIEEATEDALRPEELNAQNDV